MALFPCDASGHRYTGRQRAVYVTRLQGSDGQTRKARLCDQHLNMVEDQFASSLALIDGDSQMSLICETCGEPRVATIMARVYAEAGEPRMYAADLCGPHAADFLRDCGFERMAPLAPMR